MRTYQKVSETVERTILTELKCDLCGRLGIRERWETGYYKMNETHVLIHQKEGHTYPDGSGYGTEYIVDLCPKCFKNRLIPWLQSQGANIDQLEWDC